MRWDGETERVLRQDEREMARRAARPLADRIRDADRHARGARGYGLIEGEPAHLRLLADDLGTVVDDLLPTRQPISLLERDRVLEEARRLSQ